jgi:DNA-binding GntR family transcriptional regulator
LRKVHCRQESSGVKIFEPLDQRTTPAAVYQQIRRAILEGHLPAGSQLLEAHISRDMGISRSPLREALARLEEDGLIEKVPFRGAFVAEVRPEIIQQIATLRVLVEPYAVHTAIHRMQEAESARLDQELASQRAAVQTNDPAEMIEAHLSFHRLFYELSGNELLLDLWNSWESKLQLFLVADHQAFGDLKEVPRAHQQLVEVIRRGDQAAILEAVRHHIHVAPGVEAAEGIPALEGWPAVP